MAALFEGLLQQDLSTVTFQPFREGVEIASLMTLPDAAMPSVALLRYAPGSSVPWHEHAGTETICVLSGAQADDEGIYRTGDVVVNEPGSRHRVWSDEGCVVLIAWAEPVRMLEGNEG